MIDLWRSILLDATATNGEETLLHLVEEETPDPIVVRSLSGKERGKDGC